MLEGDNQTVCLQLSGGLQEAVDVNIVATPGSAQGTYAVWWVQRSSPHPPFLLVLSLFSMATNTYNRVISC